MPPSLAITLLYTDTVGMFHKRLSMVIQRANAKYWLNAKARMHDSIIDNATHCQREVVD